MKIKKIITSIFMFVFSLSMVITLFAENGGLLNAYAVNNYNGYTTYTTADIQKVNWYSNGTYNGTQYSYLANYESATNVKGICYGTEDHYIYGMKRNSSGYVAIYRAFDFGDKDVRRIDDSDVMNIYPEYQGASNNTSTKRLSPGFGIV